MEASEGEDSGSESEEDIIFAKPKSSRVKSSPVDYVKDPVDPGPSSLSFPDLEGLSKDLESVLGPTKLTPDQLSKMYALFNDFNKINAFAYLLAFFRILYVFNEHYEYDSALQVYINQIETQEEAT